MRRKHPTFGFAHLANATRPSSDTTLSDSFEELAARLGFISREPVALIPSLKSMDTDTVRFTIEVTIADRDVFAAYCRKNDLTEQGAFGNLVALLNQ